MKLFDRVKISAIIVASLFSSLAISADDSTPGDYEELCQCVDPHNGVRKIPVLIRDFKKSHPDFQSPVELITYGWDRHIVTDTLGDDGRPVYKYQDCASTPTKACTMTTFGKDYFNQWYRSVPGVNTAIPKTLDMVEFKPGFYRYTNSNFFPIDGEGFGNQGYPHNYHFTLETHLKFFYVEGGYFTFNGDDDLWIFINGKLAINIGGVHGATHRTVNLDDIADQLGIEPNNTYSFDLFFAERRYSESSFRFETSFELQCL